MESAYRVVLISAPNRTSARQIALRLVEAKLAACVNMLPGVTSFYFWEGKMNEDEEVLLLCKTRRECLEQLEATVKAIHPYQLPEIISLPLSEGSREYLHWVEESVQQE